MSILDITIDQQLSPLVKRKNNSAVMLKRQVITIGFTLMSRPRDKSG